MTSCLRLRLFSLCSFLAAFSGTLGGQTIQDYFVPPVFDLMRPGAEPLLEGIELLVAEDFEQAALKGAAFEG